MTPYKGSYYFTATKKAAEIWAVDLRRPAESIISVELPDETPCIINTHGYVEADWVWGHSTNPKMPLYRVAWTIGEAVNLLAMLSGDSAYDHHEVVVAVESIK
jgi:hypothetical protein